MTQENNQSSSPASPEPPESVRQAIREEVFQACNLVAGGSRMTEPIEEATDNILALWPSASPLPVAGLPTPETDANRLNLGKEHGGIITEVSEFVAAEVSASLERRLTAARAEVERVKAINDQKWHDAECGEQHRLEAESLRTQLATANAAVVEALEKTQQMHAELFRKCLSNGVFNRWGEPVNCTYINDAGRLAANALQRLNVIQA